MLKKILLILLITTSNNNSIFSMRTYIWLDSASYIPERELIFIKAAQDGDLKKVEELINKVAINVRDEYGFTALMRACQTFIWGTTEPYEKKIRDLLKRKLEIIKIILSEPCFVIDFDCQDNIMHWTALQWAEESKNNEAIKILKEAIEKDKKKLSEFTLGPGWESSTNESKATI